MKEKGIKPPIQPVRLAPPEPVKRLAKRPLSKKQAAQKNENVPGQETAEKD